MICTDGVKRYEWETIALAPNETHLLGVKHPAPDELIHFRIAHCKVAVNKASTALYDLFAQMRAEEYPLPHECDWTFKALTDDPVAWPMLMLRREEGYKTSGESRRDLAYVDDWPLMADYIRLSNEREALIQKLNVYLEKART